MEWKGFQGLPVLLRVWMENWQVGERQRGARLICSSKGELGEASQSVDNVMEMEEEVMGPPQLEISNGLAVPFLGRTVGLVQGAGLGGLLFHLLGSVL